MTFYSEIYQFVFESKDKNTESVSKSWTIMSTVSSENIWTIIEISELHKNCLILFCLVSVDRRSEIQSDIRM